MYPLVRELAADGVAVAVTCRVLKLARQPYYRWLAKPVGDAELCQNAVEHGYPEDAACGTITVDPERIAGRLRVTVDDAPVDLPGSRVDVAVDECPDGVDQHGLFVAENARVLHVRPY